MFPLHDLKLLPRRELVVLWKCTNCNGNHSAAYKGCLSIKAAISKSMDRRQNLSYAQAACRRTAKEEIEAFKTSVLINKPSNEDYNKGSVGN